MDVRLREEYALNETEVETIKGLLVQGFPDEPCFADRIYYKQIPHCRVLAEIDGIIVGQCGLDHRVISTSEGPARIFGVIDVCVAKSRRGKGLALEILQWVEELAVRSNVDFLMLFASLYGEIVDAYLRMVLPQRRCTGRYSHAIVGSISLTDPHGGCYDSAVEFNG